MPPNSTGRDNLRANFDPSNTTFGNVVAYSCDLGFRLIGSSSLTCLASGNWSGDAPTCQGMFINISFMLRKLKMNFMAIL